MSIRRHTLYNILGSIAPLGISLVTVPIYLHTIGEARYGVLAIVWLFTGYFGVFDMGLARASAYHLARQRDEAPGVRSTTFWTALWLNLSFGLLGAVVLYVVAQPVFAHFFHMSEALRRNVLVSLPWIAATLPLGTLGGVLVGALQARERFGYMNLIGVLNTALTQIAPLIVAIFISPELTWLIPAIVLARASGLVLLFAGVWRFLPIVPSALFDRARAREMFSYGGWVFVTNIAVSVLSTFDRMVIGAMLNVQAVAYYTVPYSLVNRLNILPGAFTASLFPRFSRVQDEEGKQLAMRALTGLMAVTTPLAVMGMAALHLFLYYWISPEFSHKSAATGMILLAGVWINGLAFVPYSLLEGQNRPGIIAKLHIAELPIFLLILWGGIHWLGLPGAALAPTLMAALDAIVLFSFAGMAAALKDFLLPAALILGSVISAPHVLFSIPTFLALIIVFVSTIWALFVSPELRHAFALATRKLHIFST
ncbi:hypothetical protein BBC27_13635 [Acidithiobacillus ferrivorans]|uniref:Polysaccharide biosynthesis protein n=1 Tax=Acidithiobacillus ferrivorans TaxID=160808 RepID=A0A1B9BXB1_9PROT|nr:flippase [Acidithiobacillus ferrivorans]OCB02365.1 hypothetical protein BBC27_13635 [Acidithiobacillus ferrivorans]